MNDLLKTQLQGAGSCRCEGLSVIEIADIVQSIGVDPRLTRVIRGRLVVTEDRLMGGKSVTLR